ncbi:PIH1 domain-containing protein 2-like [Mercenaria mercenaria]|uniref:PIH1 domain-containing protein 2-like n=1 Tax=Mercenaria mercenaria TaxID=6596 RepID=UPI00234F2C61|nr:PIH1 domain-containing protein 2-like [Mercenaria mercenaria]XP_045207539.2 PIH1 domain-containing protein 2-like [Mercenaria mercenaria]
MEGAYSSDAMMRQAQQVWSMLDDMADNDPKAYKAFIDKQASERKEFMAPPESCMCVQTQMVKPKSVKFFINFCSWKRIPPPADAEEPVKVAGSAIGNDDGGSAAVTAVAFNEKILKEYGKNATNTADQDILIQIAMDFIEKQHPHVTLNRKYKILERSHKGSLKLIQESLFQAFQTKDKKHEENLEHVMKQFAPATLETPDMLLKQLYNQDDNNDNEINKGADSVSGKLSGITLNTKPVGKGLIEEVSNTTVTLPEPVYDLSLVQTDLKSTKSFLLKIKLPGVKSVKECELDISKEEVLLVVDGMYELKLTLPSPIVCSQAAAKFIKKSSVLTVNMPINK